MIVYLNEEETRLDYNLNLSQLISKRNINSKGIAIAINEMVIPRNKWETTMIKENDNILIIRATQGG